MVSWATVGNGAGRLSLLGPRHKEARRGRPCALRPTWYYESTGGAFKSSLSGPIPLTSKLYMTWNIHEWDLK